LAASRCLFSLPFLLPHLDAASGCRLAKQNHCALQYRRPIADLERSLENSAFSVHYSLFTIHCEAVAVWQNKITARYNTADQLQMSKESGS
jgi:hypothetical protein